MAVDWRQYGTARYLIQSEECPLELQTKSHHTLIQFLDILSIEDFLKCIDGISYDGRYDTFLWLCLYRSALAGNVAIVEEILETYESRDIEVFLNVMNMSLSHYLAGLKLIRQDIQITDGTHETVEVNDCCIGEINEHLSPTAARIEILRQLASKQIALQRDCEGRLPLWYAAKAGNTDLIPVLVEHYRDDYNEEDINSAIYAALSWKHPATVAAILYSMPDMLLDETTKSCIIALIDSDWKTYSSILLECKDRNVNQHFFSHACRLGEVDKMSMMLEHGVDINHQDLMGLSALHEAAQVGHYTIVRGLLDAGADCNIQDCRSDSPLHHVCMRNTAQPADNNTQSVDMLKTLQVLISSNTIDLNLTNIHGHTALVEGIVHHNKGMVEYLLHHSREKLQLDLSGTTGISYMHSMLLDQGTSLLHPHTTTIPKDFRTVLPTNIFEGKCEICADSPKATNDLLAHFKCLTCDRHFAYFGDAGNCHKNFEHLAIPKRTKVYRIQYRCEVCHGLMNKDECNNHVDTDKDGPNYKEMKMHSDLHEETEPKNCYYCNIHFKYRRTAKCVRHNQDLTVKIYIPCKSTSLHEDNNKTKLTKKPTKHLIQQLMMSSATHRMGINFTDEHER